MSIWIYEHDTGRSIKKKKKSISNLVSSPLCWQSASDIYLKNKNKRRTNKLREAKCLSVYNSFKRKASRAGVWPEHFRMSASEFVIPEIYRELLINQNLVCKVKFQSFLSLLCAKTQGCAPIWAPSTVATCPPLHTPIAREPSTRARLQQSSRDPTLTRAAKNLLTVSRVLGFLSQLQLVLQAWCISYPWP